MLQIVLKNYGFYPYKIDGKFGPVSKNALINFQEKNNLQSDGILGNNTCTALINKTKVIKNNAPTISAKNVSIPSEQIKNVQESLKNLSLYSGDVDGCRCGLLRCDVDAPGPSGRLVFRSGIRGSRWRRDAFADARLWNHQPSRVWLAGGPHRRSSHPDAGVFAADAGLGALSTVGRTGFALLGFGGFWPFPRRDRSFLRTHYS